MDSSNKCSAILNLETKYLTPKQLLHISTIAQRYNIEIIELTTNRQIKLVDFPQDQLNHIESNLGIPLLILPKHSSLHLQFCPGLNRCKRGQVDTHRLSTTLQEKIRSIQLPGKTKIGLSGCPSNCSGGMVKDIGIFGTKDQGWTVVVGGNSGKNPRIGDILAETLPEQECLNLVCRLLTYYQQNSYPTERLYQFVPRVGIRQIREACFDTIAEAVQE